MPLEHLENAPLVEAIFEIRFPGEPAVLTRLDDYYGFIRDSYPSLWVPNAQQGQAPALQPWEFKNTSGTRWVGISVNSFAFHVRDYVDYADFKSTVLPLASQFCDLFSISVVNRLAAKYVNSIALLRAPGAPIRMERYLNVSLDLPDVVEWGALEDIHLQFATRSGDHQLGVTLHHVPGENGPAESLIFALDCALVGDVLTASLEAHVDRVHDRIEDTFMAFVADPYMRYLKGETA